MPPAAVRRVGALGLKSFFDLPTLCISDDNNCDNRNEHTEI